MAFFFSQHGPQTPVFTSIQGEKKNKKVRLSPASRPDEASATSNLLKEEKEQQEAIEHIDEVKMKETDLMNKPMRRFWKVEQKYNKLHQPSSPRKRNAKKQNGCLGRPYK